MHIKKYSRLISLPCGPRVASVIINKKVFELSGHLHKNTSKNIVNGVFPRLKLIGLTRRNTDNVPSFSVGNNDLVLDFNKIRQTSTYSFRFCMFSFISGLRFAKKMVGYVFDLAKFGLSSFLRMISNHSALDALRLRID